MSPTSTIGRRPRWYRSSVVWLGIVLTFCYASFRLGADLSLSALAVMLCLLLWSVVAIGRIAWRWQPTGLVGKVCRYALRLVLLLALLAAMGVAAHWPLTFRYAALERLGGRAASTGKNDGHPIYVDWIHSFYGLPLYDEPDHLWLVTGTQLADDDLAIAARFPETKDLRLHNQPITDAGLAHLQALHLEHLELSGTGVRGPGLAHVKTNCLSELFLDDTALADEGLAHLARSATLRSLDVSNTQVTATGLSALHVLPSLTWLHVGGLTLDGDDWPRSSDLPKLKRLVLRQSKLSKPAWRGVFCLPALRSLTANQSDLVDDDLIAATSPSLASVDLSMTGISDKGAQTIAGWTQLTALYLDGCQITDEGLAALAALPAIETLSLSHSQVRGEGLQAWRKHPTLQHLILSYNRLQLECCDELANLPVLATVELQETGLDENAVARLRAMLPRCVVVDE